MADYKDIFVPTLIKGGRQILLSDSRMYADLMELLQVRLAQDFLNLWAMSEKLSKERQIAYLVDALEDLQGIYGTDAAAIAAEFLDYLRQGENLPVVLADPATRERVGAAVGWAMSKYDTRALLFGAMQRMMRESYRETIRLSAFEAGNGFARVPEPGACTFCLMLSSRGAVYESEEEAIRAGHSKWSRSSRFDKKYHDNCQCDAVEVSETVGLPESNALLYDLWKSTFWGDDYHSKPKRKDGIDAVTFGKAFPIWEKVIKEKGLPWGSNDTLTS